MTTKQTDERNDTSRQCDARHDADIAKEDTDELTVVEFAKLKAWAAKERAGWAPKDETTETIRPYTKQHSDEVLMELAQWVVEARNTPAGDDKNAMMDGGVMHEILRKVEEVTGKDLVNFGD